MLFQHHGILEDRERLLGNVSTLKKQNIGLKSKLDKLLKEDINDDTIGLNYHKAIIKLVS